jgi:hypothetical protein
MKLYLMEAGIGALISRSTDTRQRREIRSLSVSIPRSMSTELFHAKNPSHDGDSRRRSGSGQCWRPCSSHDRRRQHGSAPVGHLQPRAQQFTSQSPAEQVEQQQMSTFDAQQQKEDAELDRRLNICRGC